MRGLLVGFLASVTAAAVLLPGWDGVHAATIEEERAYEAQSQWVTLEDGVGRTYEVDVAPQHIERQGANRIVRVRYESDHGPRGTHRLWFDCHGYYHDVTEKPLTRHRPPPSSVAGRIQRLACGG